MSSSEKTRLLIGSLLIAASLALGAGLDEARAPASQEPTTTTTPATTTTTAPATSSTTTVPPAATAATTITPAAALPAPAADAEVAAAAGPPAPEAALLVLEGTASWVSDRLAGRATASGEPYDPRALVAAHRALPFGTRLRVTNLGNGRSVEVRVVDRGPFVEGRIVDLSRAAAERIGILRAGHGRVRVEILEYGA